MNRIMDLGRRALKPDEESSPTTIFYLGNVAASVSEWCGVHSLTLAATHPRAFRYGTPPALDIAGNELPLAVAPDWVGA